MVNLVTKSDHIYTFYGYRLYGIFTDFSIVDYKGSCQTIGLIDVKNPCPNVKCNGNLPIGCPSFIPTGACCPKCGGGLKLIYSRKQIDRGQKALESFGTDLIILKSILNSIKKMIKSPSCMLSGYITIESDIFIIIYDILKPMSAERSEICRLESIKIANLISMRSHHVTSSLSLSFVISVDVVVPTTSKGSSVKLKVLILFLCFVVISALKNL